jgi:hypothetical protein
VQLLGRSKVEKGSTSPAWSALTLQVPAYSDASGCELEFHVYHVASGAYPNPTQGGGKTKRKSLGRAYVTARRVEAASGMEVVLRRRSDNELTGAILTLSCTKNICLQL